VSQFLKSMALLRRMGTRKKPLQYLLKLSLHNCVGTREGITKIAHGVILCDNGKRVL